MDMPLMNVALGMGYPAYVSYRTTRNVEVMTSI